MFFAGIFLFTKRLFFLKLLYAVLRWNWVEYGAKHSPTVSKIRWPSRAKSKVPTFHMSAAMFFIIYKNIDQTRCRRIIGVFCRYFIVHEKVSFSKVAICSAQMKLSWIFLKLQFFQSNMEFWKYDPELI